jgi:hypothetical protein
VLYQGTRLRTQADREAIEGALENLRRCVLERAHPRLHHTLCVKHIYIYSVIYICLHIHTHTHTYQSGGGRRTVQSHTGGSDPPRPPARSLVLCPCAPPTYRYTSSNGGHFLLLCPCVPPAYGYKSSKTIREHILCVIWEQILHDVPQSLISVLNSSDELPLVV